QYLNFAPHRALFENAHQKPALPTGGYVHISFVEAENKEEKMQAYPEKIVEIIRNLEEKKYSKSQMCILVRKHEEGIAVANYLSENGIAITSSETLLLDNSPKVRVLANLLKFTLDLSDQNLKLELLYSLWEIFPVEEGQHRFFSKGLATSENDFFDFLKTYGFDFELKNFQTLPLYDAVEYAIRSFHLINDPDAYLQFFLDFVFEHAQKNKGGIPGFVEAWESKKGKLSISAPEGQNAVRIMTIHKAKGLEFPIVIYPFVNDQIDDTKLDSVWVPLEAPMNDIPMAYLRAGRKLLDYGENAAAEYKKLLLQKELDALDMLYVALTRPTQQLHIISEFDNSKKDKIPNSFSLFLIDFLKAAGKWDATKPDYEFGKLGPNVEKKEVPEPVSKEAFISSSPASHNLNVVTRSGKLWNTPQGLAIDKGNLLHEIMALIYTESDVENALEEILHKGLIDREEFGGYEKSVLKIVTHPLLKKYFDPKSKSFNEKEILHEREILRPDRVNFDQNRATVIDYKTGGFSILHEQQINRYAQAIGKMGFEIDKKLLVYIDDGPTVKIV
ncbi:MAG TPA: 3'-5' exonuclease, partial [Flavobacteriaceae bacterium]|nr:3'-5' exonuclease [Flavobacteriaceae bacterium]